MKYRSTIVLLGLLLVVGVYFIWVEQPSHLLSPEERRRLEEEAQEGQPVFAPGMLSADLVSALTVRYNNQAQPIEITKQGKDWIQTQPVRYPLNSYSVEQIVEDAVALRYFQRFKPGSDGYPSLEQAGLAQPEMTLSLQTGDAARPAAVIHFGRPSVSGRAYARVGNDPEIYVVHEALRESVEPSRLVNARKRSFEAPTAGEVETVEFTHGVQKVRMNKSEGNWFFDAPLEGRVSRQAIRKICDAVRDASPVAFEADNPEDLGQFGLENPEIVVRLVSAPVAPAPEDSTVGDTTQLESPATQPDQPASPQTKTLFIGSAADMKKEHFYAAWTEGDAPITVVFTLSSTDVEQFATTVDDLRDPRITTLGSSDVRELTVQRQNMEPIQLLRDPEGWSPGTPGTPGSSSGDSAESVSAPTLESGSAEGPGYDVDDGLASTLLDTVVETKAEGYLPDFQPSGQPLATIQMRGIGQSQTQQVRLYADSDPKFLIALYNDETVGYRVGAEPLQQLFAPLILLRDRNVVNLSADELKEVTLTHPDGRRYVFRRQGGESSAEPPASQPDAESMKQTAGPWKLEGADKFESAAFEGFLKEWLPVRCESWLSQPPADAGEAATVLTLVASDGQNYQIHIDAEHGRGFVKSQRDWFELTGPMIKQLTQEFRDRTVLKFSAEEIAEITMTMPDGSVTLRCDASGHLVPNDPKQQFDHAAVTQLVDTLAGLRVERFIEPSRSAPPAAWQWAIKTKNGEAHQISLFSSEGELWTATVDGVWCTLGPDAATKLRTPLISEKLKAAQISQPAVH